LTEGLSRTRVSGSSTVLNGFMRNEFCPAEVPAEASGGQETAGSWFALSVTVRHEKIVSELLRNKGFETFLPLYKRRHQYFRRFREFELPLFPGYLFCRTNLTTRLPIMTTPGVIRIIGAGRTPIPVDNTEISSLRKAVEAGVAMSPHHYFQPGQIGRVRIGPLAGVEGVVVKAKHSLRLVLSVTLLQRAVMLEIDSSCVALVTNESPAAANRL
jgi:transcription antitermination factor NusG